MAGQIPQRPRQHLQSIGHQGAPTNATSDTVSRGQPSADPAKTPLPPASPASTSPAATPPTPPRTSRKRRRIGTREVVVVVLITVVIWGLIQIFGNGPQRGVIVDILTSLASLVTILLFLGISVKIQWINDFFGVCDAFFGRAFVAIWAASNWVAGSKIAFTLSLLLNVTLILIITHPPAVKHAPAFLCQGKGICVAPETDGEQIGISDGQYHFWPGSDTNNAELKIYAENQSIAIGSHVTLVVVATLSPGSQETEGYDEPIKQKQFVYFSIGPLRAKPCPQS